MEDNEQTIDSELELDLDNPESRVTEWVEKEPTLLTRIHPFTKPKNGKPNGNVNEALAALRALVEQHGERITAIEQHIPDLGQTVVTFNTRWGHIVFNATDLASVDGATRTWVESILPSIGNVIDGGLY